MESTPLRGVPRNDSFFIFGRPQIDIRMVHVQMPLPSACVAGGGGGVFQGKGGRKEFMADREWRKQTEQR